MTKSVFVIDIFYFVLGTESVLETDIFYFHFGTESVLLTVIFYFHFRTMLEPFNIYKHIYSTFISGPESSSSKGEPKVNGGKSVICLDE